MVSRLFASLAFCMAFTLLKYKKLTAWQDELVHFSFSFIYLQQGIVKGFRFAKPCDFKSVAGVFNRSLLLFLFFVGRRV